MQSPRKKDKTLEAVPAAPRARGRPKKEQPDADTRQLILQAAVQEFLEHGYQAASVASICKKAMIANGTFYIHFPDKTELYKQLVAGTFTDLAKALVQAQNNSAGLNPKELELRDVQLIVDFFESHSDMLLILINERGLGPGEQGSLVDMFAAQRAADFRRGSKTGQFRGDFDPVVMAYAETGLTMEVLRWWLRNRRVISKARLVEELYALRLRMHPPA